MSASSWGFCWPKNSNKIILKIFIKKPITKTITQLKTTINKKKTTITIIITTKWKITRSVITTTIIIYYYLPIKSKTWDKDSGFVCTIIITTTIIKEQQKL